MKTFAAGFKLAAAAMVVAVGAYAAPAAAATCTSPQGVDFTLEPASDAACFSGNDSNTINATFELFSQTGWELAYKLDDDGTHGDQSITFLDLPVAGENPATWGISGTSFTDIVVTLKQANGFGAFLISGLSGTWGTKGPGASVNDLSHASIYYQPGGTVVPLPASALLLLSGLGGLGLLGWRRRATHA